MSLSLESVASPDGSQLEGLSYIADPSEQLRLLLRYNNALSNIALPETSIEALSDFAAESDQSSLCVRVEALERVLEQGTGSEIMNTSAQNLPAIEVGARWFDGSPNSDDQAFHSQGRSYRYVTSILMREEQLDPRLVFPDHFLTGNNPAEMPDANPFRAYVFLDSVRAKADDCQNLSSEAAALVEKFLPLATSLHQKMAELHHIPDVQNVTLSDWVAISSCSRLLKYGASYRGVLTELLNVGDTQTMDYIRLLGGMEQWAHTASNAFPEAFREGAADSMRHLLADVLYAVADHLSNQNTTHAELPLGHGNSVLNLNLQGDEPLELIEHLQNAFKRLAYVGRMSKDKFYPSDAPGGFSGSHTISVIKNKDAVLYRLIDRDEGARVSAYVRPYGSPAYDKQLEYGRPGEGVEASISFVIDPVMQEHELLEVGKHRRQGPDNRISIRLDREGIRPAERGQAAIVRDPTQTEGTLSLDVGSVLGDDSWLGTKIGRFLAWGNLLRTQALGEHSQLNHVTEYFDVAAGNADFFATQARKFIQELEDRQLSKKEVAALFGGRAALGAHL